jgi:hypothetical protein
VTDSTPTELLRKILELEGKKQYDIPPSSEDSTPGSPEPPPLSPAGCLPLLEQLRKAPGGYRAGRRPKWHGGCRHHAAAAGAVPALTPLPRASPTGAVSTAPATPVRLVR